MLSKASLAVISLFLTLFAFSSPAAATDSRGDTLDLQVNIGFNSVVKQGSWIPVIAMVQNNSKGDFSGSVAVETYSGGTNGMNQNLAGSPQNYAVPLQIPRGKQQQKTIYIPFNADPLLPGGILVELLDTHNQVVRTRTKTINAPDPGSITIGILSDRHTGFDILKNLNMPTQQAVINYTFLDAKTLPTLTTVLNNFDLIVLDDFPTQSLSAEQLNALHTWVNQGGRLLEMGGADWQQTLAPLPQALRPVNIDGAFELPASTRLFPQESQDAHVKVVGPEAPLSASMATTEGNGSRYSTLSILSSYNDIPLFVQAREGKGSICYFALDLASPALARWTGKSSAWTQVLMHVLQDRTLIISGAQKYNNGQGGLLTRGGVLPVLEPNFSFAPLTFLLLLFSYVFFLGPVRLLIRWRLKRPAWSWRIVLSGIVIFTLVSYGIAFYQKNASLTNNSLSVMQLNEDGSNAHTTTYMGVFIPNKGTFALRIPGVNQVLAVADPQVTSMPYGSTMDPGASVIYGPRETSINLEASDTWTYHPMVIERDQHLPGGVEAQLKLQGENLIGTITNHLKTGLNDMYVLMPHGFVALGHLNAGEKRTVFSPVQGNTTGNAALLADQITRSRGLPSAYFPYANQGQPQNDFQRHMAQLSILSGAGTPFIPCESACSARAIVSNQNIFISSRTRNINAALMKGNDPLLLQNASATVIGWSDQTLDGSNEITINGSHPGGYHDTMLQMPVTLHLAAPFRLQTNSLPGRAVSIQASDVAQVAPNLYTISKGNVEFEFDFPNKVNPYVQMLSISMPHALNGKTFPRVYGYLQTSLYNWSSGTWDKFLLYPDSLNTTNATDYIGRGGSLLLQITSPTAAKSAPSQIYFSRPELSLL